jgi:hypothetical protein
MNKKPLIENVFWQREEECMPKDQLRALQLQKLRALVASPGVPRDRRGVRRFATAKIKSTCSQSIRKCASLHQSI